MRLRVHRVERLGGGVRGASSTVFCPAHCRSLDLGECLACPRLSRAQEDAGTIDCAPPTSRLAASLLADRRLGGDTCVGEAMGNVAILVDAEVAATALARSLDERGAAVAVVVDEAGRLAGVAHKEDATEAGESARAREVARQVAPVHEASHLADAVERMVHERARVLPVVDDDDHVVALLTDIDALHWLAERNGAR